MDNGLAMVTVAVVTAVGGVIVAVIHSARKENRQDHAVVADNLTRLTQIALRTEDKVDTVKDELHSHLDWHQGDTDERTSKSTSERTTQAEQQLPR